MEYTLDAVELIPTAELASRRIDRAACFIKRVALRLITKVYIHETRKYIMTYNEM